MRLAVFKSMWWSLLRDRGALVMSFVLPPLVFVIYAVIFSGASGGDFTVKLAVFDARESEASQRLLSALTRLDAIDELPAPDSAETLASWVREGRADVGVVVLDNASPFGARPAGAPAPLMLVADPTREIAVSALMGALQSAYLQALPDAVVASVLDLVQTRMFALEPGQQAALAAGLEAMADGAASPAAQTTDLGLAALTARRNVIEPGTAPVNVTYYAGAVAIMFLLFSASNSAMSLIDERDSGLLARLASGPGGPTVVVDGKFAFLVAQGFVQVSLIFAVAWIGFGVEVFSRLAPWAVTSLAAAVAAAGLALAFVSVCRSRQQANSLGSFTILIMSALGGSMVPRFFMPESVRVLGWLTPNTWVLEAYAITFWRAGSASLWPPLLALSCSGAIGLVAARFVVARSRTRPPA